MRRYLRVEIGGWFIYCGKTEGSATGGVGYRMAKRCAMNKLGDA
tara:strand:- start:288 stop:419 length:132 start_codon:yes stop_codon:yes gene_type:complete